MKRNAWDLSTVHGTFVARKSLQRKTSRSYVVSWKPLGGASALMCTATAFTYSPDRKELVMTKKLRALTTAGALVLAGAFGVVVVATGGSGNGATLGLFLAGGYAAYQLMRGTSE